MCPARQQQTELCWQKKTSWKAPSILQIRQIQPLGTGSRRGYANPKASRFTYVHRTLGKDKYLLLRKIITIKILILEFLWSPFNLEVLTDLRNTDIKTLNQNSKWQARYTDIFLKNQIFSSSHLSPLVSTLTIPRRIIENCIAENLNKIRKLLVFRWFQHLVGEETPLIAAVWTSFSPYTNQNYLTHNLW